MKSDLTFLDISAMNDRDDARAVQFKCGACGRASESVLPEAASAELWSISQSRCPNTGCLQFSGFHYHENKPSTPSDLKEVCALLSQYLNSRTPETRLRIQALMEGRNMKLLFGIKKD